MDEIRTLQAFYDAYMEFVGDEADRVNAESLTVQDRATIEGLRAAIATEAQRAETVKQGSVHEGAVPTAIAQPQSLSPKKESDNG